MVARLLRSLLFSSNKQIRAYGTYFNRNFAQCTSLRPSIRPGYSSTCPRKHPVRAQRLESAATVPILALVIAAFGAGIYAWIKFPPTRPDNVPRVPSNFPLNQALAIMPQVQQGWPGNLTSEQESKLQELWLALGQVTGVVKEQPHHNVENGVAAEADTPKRKGKRFGFFGRSEKEDDAKAHSASDGSEDKYGQTKQFKQALQDMTPEELHETIWSFTKADSPDALLLRFLRARKWNVQNALVMFVSTAHWRAKDIKMDTEIVPRGEAWFADRARNGSGDEKQLGRDFMAQIRMGKSFIHGTDKEGRPMCFVRVRLHKSGDQSEEALEKFTVYTIETARMMLNEQVDTAGIVFDMTDFSLSNMDYTPVKFMIKIFEANYPESLGHICVHRSPWVFSSIWKIIRGWLDPVVAAKVHFTDDVKALSEFVDRNHIPQELGGDEDFDYHYIEPQPGENDELEAGRKDGRLSKLQDERKRLVDEFEKSTMEWCRGEGGEGVVKRRKELTEQLKQNYWRMDPFVRARTLYDRQGVIGKDGSVNMYPSRSPSDEPDGVD